MSDGSVVRDAVLADAEAIGRIHVRCWRHAYAGLVPDALLASRDEDVRVGQWRARLAVDQPDRTSTLVVVDGSDVVRGFAQVGPTQDGTGGPDLGELYAIYLSPAAIGIGVGRELLAAATDRLRAAGFTAARLDVLPGNDRARRVYEAAGWHASGDAFDVSHGEHVLPHQRYVREL